MEGRRGELFLSVYLLLIEEGMGLMGDPSRSYNPCRDKFTRHHFQRVLVKGFEQLKQVKKHGGKTRKINMLVGLAIKVL